MAGKKNLGMGLDVLLTATEVNRSLVQNKADVIAQIMANAIEKDENGNTLEAYYLYRLVIDHLESGYLKIPENSALISQALNNAAILLFENGQTERAREYLEKALLLNSNNNTARENLETICGNS